MAKVIRGLYVRGAASRAGLFFAVDEARAHRGFEVPVHVHGTREEMESFGARPMLFGRWQVTLAGIACEFKLIEAS